MGATFSRLKNWIAEVLTYADLNAEIDNILNNFVPLGMDDFSFNVAQMRLTANPGTTGFENLATSLAGEIEALRYTIQIMKGNVPNWYDPANSSINELSTILGSTLQRNRLVSGKMQANSSQPIFLKPSGIALTITLNAGVVPFQYFINGVQYTISVDTQVTSLVAAPATQNTAQVNYPGIQAIFKQTLGEWNWDIPIDNIGANISALTGKFAAFAVVDGVSTEYFIARVGTNKLYDVRRTFFFDSTQTAVLPVPMSDNDVITLLKLTWVFAKTDGSLAVTYNNPSWSKAQPTSPAPGDYWFDVTNATWKTFNSTVWVSASATLIGICAQDSTKCIAARAFDFSTAVFTNNSLRVIKNSNSTVVTLGSNNELSVRGNLIYFGYDNPLWDITANLDSGYVEQASTYYYLYLTEQGGPVMSPVAPTDRSGDLGGLYHPHQTWRCVGICFNDGSSNIAEVVSVGIPNREPDLRYAAVVGTLANIIAGNATYALVSEFETDASGGESILLLPGTYTENLTLSKELHILGRGRGAILDGTIVFATGSTYSSMHFIKVTGNVTINSAVDGIFFADNWLSTTKTVTDSNLPAGTSANSIRYITEA